MISKKLNDCLAKRYGKTKQEGLVKRAFDLSNISEAMQVTISNAFTADCCVVFSDISGFSRRMKGKTPEQIKTFLDDYYSHVIPTIYNFGGLVDQMLGDGIISVYCKELNPECDNVFDAGLRAAEEIVKSCAGNANYSSKCALHKGSAVICNIGDNNYRQATLIGEIMTVVHRVESVARDQAVNMLLSIREAKEELDRVVANPAKAKPVWTLDVFEADLKGLGDEKHLILYEEYTP